MSVATVLRVVFMVMMVAAGAIVILSTTSHLLAVVVVIVVMVSVVTAVHPEKDAVHVEQKQKGQAGRKTSPRIMVRQGQEGQESVVLRVRVFVRVLVRVIMVVAMVMMMVSMVVHMATSTGTSGTMVMRDVSRSAVLMKQLGNHVKQQGAHNNATRQSVHVTQDGGKVGTQARL